jgi:hypothetical protein
MRKFLKYVVRFLLLLFGVALIYWLLIVFPHMFFRLERVENLYLYHHGEPEKARIVGARALTKIKRSGLYNPQATHRVFLTASANEYAFFTSLWRGSGGVFLIFARGNIFIRPSVIEQDRLIAPSGETVAEDRPLNYFIAHEAAHAMSYEKLGFSKYNALHQWVREGVADHIARDNFNFEQMLENYREDLPLMDHRKSGLYLKFQLFVEHALRHQNQTVETLLERNPSETEIAAALESLDE